MKNNLAKNSVRNNFHIPKACYMLKAFARVHIFFFLSKIFLCFHFGKHLTIHNKISEQKKNNNLYESSCL